MKIKKHYPAFCDFKPEEAEYEDIESLLKVPFVASWTEVPSFHQFSVSGNTLMAELKGGREWWVVGEMENTIGIRKWMPYKAT